jgi:hypothetical protein
MDAQSPPLITDHGRFDLDSREIQILCGAAGFFRAQCAKPALAAAELG